jgi:hypothetical protein
MQQPPTVEPLPYDQILDLCCLALGPRRRHSHRCAANFARHVADDIKFFGVDQKLDHAVIPDRGFPELLDCLPTRNNRAIRRKGYDVGREQGRDSFHVPRLHGFLERTIVCGDIGFTHDPTPQ